MSDGSDASDDDKGKAHWKTHEHPGLNAYQQDQIDHRRQVDTVLASKGVLDTAKGGMPMRVQLLQDTPMSRIPGRPGEPKHDAMVLKYEERNKQNDLKRRDFLFSAWTQIYAYLAKNCRKSCPSLYEELYEMCRMDTRGYTEGFFDGPLAYRIYIASLTPTERTVARGTRAAHGLAHTLVICLHDSHVCDPLPPYYPLAIA